LTRGHPEQPPDPSLETVLERLGVSGDSPERQSLVATDAAYAGKLSLRELRVLRRAGMIPATDTPYDPDNDPDWEPPDPAVTGRKPERPLRPITSATVPDLDAGDRFTFAVTGETRPPAPGMPFPRISQTVMAELRLLRPAFVLSTGDLIWGFDDTREEMLSELDSLRELLDKVGVPVFNVPGNHEVQSRPLALEVLEQWGHDLYGSFDVGSYHFVALNTEELDYEGRVTGAQLEWLTADLEANRSAAATFVFMHRPLFSWFQGDFNPEDVEVLRKLFAEHRVSAVFCAHEHFFYEEEHDSVRYITVGGGGAPAYVQPQGGGFSHYLLVTVAPGTVDVNVVEPNRIEVDYELGNDGVAERARARVANTTDRDLVLRNLEFRMPRAGGYDVAVDFTDFTRKRIELPAHVRAVTDMDDGSALVAVEVMIPTGTGFWVDVEARRA
jgi:3',5'-cyclic AMP phosphodiesterase CpdA